MPEQSDQFGVLGDESSCSARRVPNRNMAWVLLQRVPQQWARTSSHAFAPLGRAVEAPKAARAEATERAGVTASAGTRRAVNRICYRQGRRATRVRVKRRARASPRPPLPPGCRRQSPNRRNRPRAAPRAPLLALLVAAIAIAAAAYYGLRSGDVPEQAPGTLVEIDCLPDDYGGEGAVPCRPTRCGRLVVDNFIDAAHAEQLRALAARGMSLGGGAAGRRSSTLRAVRCRSARISSTSGRRSIRRAGRSRARSWRHSARSPSASAPR